jgi:porin
MRTLQEGRAALYLAIALSVLSAAPGYAGQADPKAPAPAPVKPAPAPRTLTGDWFGAGPAMRKAGFDSRLEWSQYYEGMTRGDGDRSGQYGGHVDWLLRIDPSKFGLWNGLSVTSEIYWQHGSSVNGFGGTLFPVNSGLFFPNVQGEDDSAVVALNMTQNIGDLWSFSLGRFNNIDGIRYRPVFGGGGVDTFWHLNPAVTSSGLVPAGINAASISLKTDPVSYSLMIYDPVDAYSKPLFHEVFENGVGVNAIATWKTSFGGKTGWYGVSGSYSSASNPNLGDIVIDTELGQAINDNISNKKGAYALAITVQQFLVQDASDPTKGWGLFGALTRSDANPTPLGLSWMLGIGGNSFLPNRPDDRFGFALGHFGMSEVLKQEISPLLRDEAVWDAFYNFAITPWFRITADAQWVRPATENARNGIFAGMQAYVKF